MNKTRVLVLGSAFAADLHLDAYSRLHDLAVVVGLCSRDSAKTTAMTQRWKLEGVTAYRDFRRAIAESDADLVDICLPNFLHAEAALAAFAAGKHVLCEKPLATTVEDAAAMVEAAHAAGRRLYYAEDWMFAPALEKAVSLVAGGGIGRLLYVRARECHSGSHSPFAQTLEFCGGGAMVHLGIHPVGFVLALKNQRWTELVAMNSGGGKGNLRHNRLEGEDWSAGLIRFEDGTTALVEANYITAGGMEDQIDLYGESGRLHIDLTGSSAIRAYSIPGFDYTVEKAEVTTGWSRPAIDERGALGYAEEMRHVIEACRSGPGGAEAKLGVRGIDGYQALRVVKLLEQSAREGRTIKNEP